jgi:hypothetical protein
MESPLKNPRHEKFSINRAKGEGIGEAYITAYPNCKKLSSARAAGSKLLLNTTIAARIECLKKKSVATFVHTKEELLNHLWKAVITPAGEANSMSPHCESVETTTTYIGKTKKNVKTKLTFQSKSSAGSQIIEMKGWKQAEKLEIDIGEKTMESVASRAARVASALDRRPKTTEETES